MSMSNIRYPYEGKPDWAHTRIGIHSWPYGHFTDWDDDARREYELGAFKRARASWVTLKMESDSFLEWVGLGKNRKPFVCHYLDEGIVPFLRDDTNTFPSPYKNFEVIPRAVAEYKPYGLRPTFIFRNEWGDVREWAGKHRPSNWREVALSLFIDAARMIRDRGANWAFADPLSDWAWWFQRFPEDLVDDMRNGVGIITNHCYGKSRRKNYPEDDVSRFGTPLTMDAYRAHMGRWWGILPTEPIEKINEQRWLWRSEDKTWRDDHTCWGSWRNVLDAWMSIHTFQPVVAMTEGGWHPDDRAGNDIRYPPSTPETVADDIISVINEPNGMFAYTFWLIYGWSFDGWLYNGMCDYNNYEQPVIQRLGEMDSSAAELLQQLRSEIAAADNIAGKL